MNTSLSWLKAYVPDLDVTAQEYTDAMTLSGTKVEGYEQLDADLEKIVIGQIDKIEKHPDADKLVVCQVNVGTETVQIVTGAKNVFEGAKVPVVLDGGRVAGDMSRDRKFRAESRSKRQAPRSGKFWYDVFYRGAGFYDRYVSGGSGRRNLYLPGGCRNRSKCD